jgi:hypothetical protein
MNTSVTWICSNFLIVSILCRQFWVFPFSTSKTAVESVNSMTLEAQSLLGCTAVFLIGCRPTFQRCVLPPSSGQCVSLAKSKSHYRWRSVNQSVLASSWPDSVLSQVWLLRSFVSWGTPSDEGAGLSFVWSLSLSFVQLYICRPTINCNTLSAIHNIYNASVSPGFVKQVMPYLT